MKQDQLNLLLVLICSGGAVFLGLRGVDHDGLASDLLIAHGQGHQHGFRRVKLDIGNSNTTERG